MARADDHEHKGGGSAGQKGGRKVSAALTQPVTPDDDLAQVVGADPLPRPQVMKKIWDYIKSAGLQDAQNRRMINADDKLKRVFEGRDQVSMFEMTKLVSRHVR